jgi:hypothetical protein
MTVNAFKRREAWLHAVTERLRPIFASHDGTIPDNIRRTCGLPSVRAFSANKQSLGQCWSESNSADGHIVAGVLAHELVHAAGRHGHGKDFANLARAIGLEGKMTATTEGDAFNQAIAPTLEAVGPYPHAELSKTASQSRGHDFSSCNAQLAPTRCGSPENGLRRFGHQPVPRMATT